MIHLSRASYDKYHCWTFHICVLVCIWCLHLFICTLINFQACDAGTYGNVTGQTSQATACRVFLLDFSAWLLCVLFSFCLLLFDSCVLLNLLLRVDWSLGLWVRHLWQQDGADVASDSVRGMFFSVGLFCFIAFFLLLLFDCYRFHTMFSLNLLFFVGLSSGMCCRYLWQCDGANVASDSVHSMFFSLWACLLLYMSMFHVVKSTFCYSVSLYFCLFLACA